tara:strand:+ start:761 stop:1330 length:570 start_codon:yes stop_codon:yes gene_type:complete
MDDIVLPLYPLYVWMRKIEFDTKPIIEELRTQTKPKVDNIDDTRNEDFMLPQDTSCKNLLPEIKEFAHRNINKFLGQISVDDLHVEEVWGQILKPGMTTAYHTHYDRQNPHRNGWSWVYYLQAETNNGNLALHAEHGLIDYTKDIRPETNLLVMFPLNTPHYTRRNTLDTERISIAGNILPIKKQGGQQ